MSEQNLQGQPLTTAKEGRVLTRGIASMVRLRREEHALAGRKIIEHFANGDTPAEAVAVSFQDAKMKGSLRFLLAEMSSEMFLTAPIPSDEQLEQELGQSLTRNKAFDLKEEHPSWRDPLQQYLDERGITIKIFEEKRSAYPKLSSQEFYEQAVGFCYAIMEYGGRMKTERYQQEFEKEATDTVATMNIQEPEKLEHVQHHLHEKGELQCDLPDSYLEWMSKDAAR